MIRILKKEDTRYDPNRIYQDRYKRQELTVGFAVGFAVGASYISKKREMQSHTGKKERDTNIGGNMLSPEYSIWEIRTRTLNKIRHHDTNRIYQNR